MTPKTQFYIYLFCAIMTFAPSKGRSQDGLSDTCELGGNVSKLIYKKVMFHEGDISYSLTHVFDYNPQGYWFGLTVKTLGVVRNKYCRVFDSTGTMYATKFSIQGESDTSREFKYEYNQLNQVDKQSIHFYEHGTKGLISETSFYYDPNRLERSDSTIISSNSNIHYHTTRFNSDGEVILDIEISPTKSTHRIFTYNENGLLIKEEFLDTSWSGRSLYNKDDNGNFIRVKHESNSDSPRTDESYVKYYTYNDWNQPIKVLKTSPEGKFISLIKSTYNDEGNELTSLVKYKPPKNNFLNEKKFKRKYTYAYVYDQYGNWTSKLTFVSNTLVTQETRTIEYF
ncbi:MAG: hypothetical protein MK078_15305 [Crocinitomicaceae bacterium]|nr:hypothetical protein [Crocinitomicaceae bacterium]